MHNLMPADGELSSSSSGSIIQFNIHVDTDLELTPLEFVKDEEALFFNNSMKDQIQESKCGENRDAVPFKSVIIKSRTTIVLDKFSAKDFKIPITWNIGRIGYRAENMADLRSRHDILIEGAFKQSTKGYLWNNYHGFLLTSGVMLYFRSESYKAFIDFSKCTVISDSKHLKLKVNTLSIDSKETTCLLKFSSSQHYKVWYAGIFQFTE